jgi:hypothetical protein
VEACYVIGEWGHVVVGVTTDKEWVRWPKKGRSNNGRGEPTCEHNWGCRDVVSAGNHDRLWR